MDSAFPDDETIRAALALAVRAPSIHNSQPWLWRVGEHTVHLYADSSRHLPHTDPARRELIVSCGVALQHFTVALAALGWQAQVHRLPNPADPDHLASIELIACAGSEQDIALAAAIPRRRTDRRWYSSWPVPGGDLALMASRAARSGVMLRRVESPRSLSARDGRCDARAFRRHRIPGRTRDVEWTLRIGCRRAGPQHARAVARRLPRPGRSPVPPCRSHPAPRRGMTPGSSWCSPPRPTTTWRCCGPVRPPVWCC